MHSGDWIKKTILNDSKTTGRKAKKLQDLWTDGSGNKDMEESERTVI